MEKFESKPKYREDYFFFNEEEFPSELNEAIDLEIQEIIKSGYKFFTIPQMLVFQDEKGAKGKAEVFTHYDKNGKEIRGEYYDLSTEEGKRAVINKIKREHSSSWPWGIREKFEELLKKKNNEDK